MIQTGSIYCVRYRLPGPAFFHQRVCVLSSPRQAFVLTPDGDQYLESVVIDNDIQEVHLTGDYTTLPFQARRTACHLFGREPSAAELERLLPAARAALSLPSPVELPLARGAPQLIDWKSSDRGLVLFDTTGLTTGKTVTSSVSEKGYELGSLLLLVDEDGVRRVVERVTIADVERRWNEVKADWRRVCEIPDPVPTPSPTAASEDARTLAVLTNSSGERYRSIRSVADESLPTELAGWPIQGPRVTKAFLQEIARQGADPSRRHQTWAIENKLQDTDRLRLLHESLSDILELLCCQDQVDATNLAGCELLIRTLLHTEREVLRKQEAKEQASGIAADLYLGRSRRHGGAIVVPALESHVASVAAQEAAILKETRKSEEEKKAAREASKKKKDNN
jgi:hypothetical protein